MCVLIDHPFALSSSHILCWDFLCQTAIEAAIETEIEEALEAAKCMLRKIFPGSSNVLIWSCGL
jgi:hypothetical protein